MKKYYLLIAVAFFTLIGFAQNNLQFNNAIHLSYSGTFSSTAGTLTTITVPENKVWKIESGSVVCKNNYSATPFLVNIMVDKQLIYEKYQGNSGNYSAFNSAPIWLGSGTYSVDFTTLNGSGIVYVAAISVLEFNITQ